jgi:hypothetical protein
MLTQLWLPILLSAVALFFSSFLSWMIVQLHKHDWVKLPQEDAFLIAIRPLNVPAGSYMFPGCNTQSEMQTAEFKQKFEQGPVGIMTVFGKVNMGRNLGLTFLYFLVVSFCLAYLGTIGIDADARFMDVFRFMATAALLAYLPAIIQHSIWFHCRITGHVVESIAYALITGAIFGAMWPAA